MNTNYYEMKLISHINFKTFNNYVNEINIGYNEFDINQLIKLQLNDKGHYECDIDFVFEQCQIYIKFYVEPFVKNIEYIIPHDLGCYKPYYTLILNDVHYDEYYIYKE